MNIVIFIGRLVKDPTLRQGENTAICNFSLALDRYGKEGEDKGADFPRITVFGKAAENAKKYLQKGSLVAVEGRVKTGSFQNSEGEKVYTTDFIANTITYLDKKGKQGKEEREDDSDEE